MKKNLLVFLLFCFATISHVALSQDTIALRMLSLEELMNIDIVGVSRYKQSSQKAPNSVIVITKNQIIDRGYEDLSDVLRDIPQFDIVDDVARFGEYYTFRGIQGSDRFLVLIDGHKINPASGTFLSIGNSISIRFAKQIEIIYGPSSAVYGADAYSGIINITTNDYAEGKSFISGSVNYGSLNSIAGSIESYYKANDNLSFTLSARYFQSDGPDIVGTDTIYNIINRYKSPQTNSCEQPIADHNIFFKTQYKNFSLSFYRQFFNEGNAIGHNPSTYIFNKENLWKMATNSVWANYKLDFGQNGILNFDLNYINHVQDPNSQFFKWKVANNVGETFNQYMTGKDNTGKGTVYYTNTLNKKLQIVAGMEFEHTKSIPPYANDEVLGNSFKYEGDNATKIDDKLTINENRTAGFGQLTYSPVEKFDLVIGGRYDYSSRYKGTFNPRMGFVFSPFESTTFKIIYGTAFQAPSLFYEYEQFGIPTTAMLSVSELQKIPKYKDWELKNQRVTSYEAAITQQFGKNIQLTVSGYYNDLSDIIERVTFADKAKGDSVFNKYFNKYTSGVRNENIGKQKIKGGNILFNALVKNNIQIYGYYSFTDAVSEISGKESDIPRVAKHKAWIGFTYSGLFDYITFSPRLKMIGKINNINTVAFPDGHQDGYSTLDLNISVNNLVKHLRFYATFENIFNKEYNEGGLFGQSGVYVPVVPQPGFEFRIGIEANF